MSEWSRALLRWGLWLTALLTRAPTWALFVLAPALLLAFLAYARWADARSRKEVDEADELKRWRDLRVIRTFALQAKSLESCTLTLELAHESDPTVSVVVLKFHGVSDLRALQFDTYPLYFDGLRATRLRRDRRDGCKLWVRDPWREMIQFYCRSFESLTPGAVVRVG